jgi:hypothetical protein
MLAALPGVHRTPPYKNCAVSGEYGLYSFTRHATEPSVGGLIGDAKDNTVVKHCSFSVQFI